MFPYRSLMKNRQVDYPNDAPIYDKYLQLLEETPKIRLLSKRYTLGIK
jgi:hypothetical protein